MLERITGPADLRRMTTDELALLAAEIRTFLVENVTRTGGHLGPNLGVVELAIALHRVFDSPADPILWDTGHQSYVHKILTGRWGEFPTLRQEGGLSGYPDRDESIHDIIENSHASTALSYADGIAKAFEVTGQRNRHVVAVVGDGALTGGMTWEAINNIAEGQDRSVIIVVNDNERSYSPTIGGLATHLATLRTTKEYERFLEWGKQLLGRTPVVGTPVYEALHGMKKGLKDFVAPQGMFEDLGIKYVGPVDGHDIEALEFAFTRAREFGAPVIVHAITTKGKGYAPAEADEADRFHAVGVVDSETGRPLRAAARTWTDAFSDELVAIGRNRPDVVAITAAMLAPTGLDAFARHFPHRTFDVGIAEQHAVTSAAGMAFAGLHPVVAVYATFLNRALDQVLMDCALHKAGVTFVLDRAGATGDDGPSHNGMWDLAFLRGIPGLQLAAPRDELRLRAALQTATTISDGPSVVRYPKGALGQEIVGSPLVGKAELLAGSANADVAVVVLGPLAAAAINAVGARDIAVVDPVWAYPIDPGLVDWLSRRQAVITVEDGQVSGGFGAGLTHALAQIGASTRVTTLGLPDEFLPVAKRDVLLARYGLDSAGIAAAIASEFSAIDSAR